MTSIGLFEEAIALDENQVRKVDQREVLTVRGASLPICRLARLFSLPPVERTRPSAFVVIAQVGSRRLGFVVDELVGQQDIVIKPLGKSLRAARGFAGATELGDQRIGPDAHTPDEAVGLDELAVVQRDPGPSRLLDGGAGPDLHASCAQHPVRVQGFVMV